MNRYTVAVLVNNQFGVLNRVTSMFRRRQFNIISLTVSETESNALSRITVTFEGGETQKQQLVNQLYKLPDVCSIKEFTPDTSVSCELMLIKLKNDSKTRSDILAAADAFGAHFESYTFAFAPIRCRGVRLLGHAGGDAHFISVAELEAYGAES